MTDAETTAEGIAEMLRGILPPDRAFVLLTFSISPSDDGINIMRSLNHRPMTSARKLRDAAALIEKKVNTT